MPYTLVIDDTFSSRADGPSVGNGWVAQDPAWHIKAGTLEAQGTLAGTLPLNGCTRPASEASVEGKVRVFVSPITFARVGAVGRYDATSGGRGFSIVLADGNLYKFGYALGGVAAEYQNWTATGVQLPASYVFDFIVTQTNATTTTLTATFYAPGDLNTVLLSVSQVDTNAGLQGYAGTFGGGGFPGYGAEIDRMATYSYSAGGPIVAGAASVDTINVTRTAAAVTSSPPSGGFGALSVQWHRGTASGFVPGAGTAVTGATGLTLADSGLTPGATYYYKLRTTDQKAGGAQVTDGNEVAVTTVRSRANGGLVIGAIGDSITFGFNSTTRNGFDTEIFALKGAGYSVGRVNAGIPGITTAGYAPGSAQFTNMLAAFQAAGVNVAQVMLGMNDCYSGASGVSKAAYKASLQSIVSALLAGGTGIERVILNQEPCTYSVNGSGTVTLSQANANLQLYQQADAEVTAATPGVVMGDTTFFAFMQANPALMSSQHPIQGGHDIMGAKWYAVTGPILTALAPPSSAARADAQPPASVAPGSVTQLSASVLPITAPQTGTWSLIAGPGTVTSGGAYTAPPASTLEQNAVLRFTTTDGTQSATVVITTPAVSVSGVSFVNPPLFVAGGVAVPLTALVAGSGNPPGGVTYAASAGTIDAAGNLTPPAATALIQPITVTATSVFDPARSVSVVVYVPATGGTLTAADLNARALIESTHGVTMQKRSRP